ncbi:MAG: YgeY family selenium metabolism-linked hydrolase [Desulfobacterales bacterium]|nr:MAG: YgeY family selenium metabolism-linked hydrolase [Desulfobacterales bacterium]
MRDIQDEVVSFTQELIQIPSLTGDEGALAQVVFEKLRAIGVDEAFIDEIGNVVGILYGGQAGPHVLLNNHLDIVPTGNLENWNGYHPFGAEIDQNGNIHGRGAADDKAGLSVQLYAMKLMKSLRDTGIALPGNVLFASVVHEEAAEMFGIEYLCKKTLPRKGITFDVVFLGEPTDLNLKLGHRGKVEIVVTTRGKTAHSSTPWAGINALQKMIPILETVFDCMGENLARHPELGQGSVTITNLVCRPGTLSIIPDECEISVDRRYVPGETLEGIVEEFQQVLEHLKKKDSQLEASVGVRTFREKSYTGYEKEVQKHHPVWITAKEHPFVRKTFRALQHVGQNPQISYWPGGTDGSLTAGLMGIPTIGYSGMQFNYAHTPQEMVSIQMMMRSLEGYFAILCELFEIDANDLSSIYRFHTGGTGLMQAHHIKGIQECIRPLAPAEYREGRKTSHGSE